MKLKKFKFFPDNVQFLYGFKLQKPLKFIDKNFNTVPVINLFFKYWIFYFYIRKKKQFVQVRFEVAISVYIEYSQSLQTWVYQKDFTKDVIEQKYNELIHKLYYFKIFKINIILF
jgi:hypothetical protein